MRTPVDTSQFPNSAHGRLFVRFPGNIPLVGSGTLVGPRHVLTAAHNVFRRALNLSNGQLLNSKVSFIAGQNGDNVIPFPPSPLAQSPILPKAWVLSEDPDFDLALLVLSANVGNMAGHLPMAVATETILKANPLNILGYANKGTKIFHGGGKFLKVVSPEKFSHTIDTFDGDSGAAVFVQSSAAGSRTILGVHTTGSATTPHTAVRLSAETIGFLSKAIMSTS